LEDFLSSTPLERALEDFPLGFDSFSPSFGGGNLLLGPFSLLDIVLVALTYVIGFGEFYP